MILVLIIAGVLWGGGALLHAPRSLRAAMIVVLWAAVVGLHLALPDGHPMRVATGNDARIWLILAGFAVLGGAYFLAIGRLKKRASVAAPADAPVAFRSAELDRYARHIMLREIGGPGQRRLKDAKVLVIGAGGLGSPALL